MTQKRRTFTVRAHSAPSKQNMGHQQNMQNKIWDTQQNMPTKYGTPRSRKANHLRLLGNWRTNGRRD